MHLIPIITAMLVMSACAAKPTTVNKSFVYENFLGEGRPEFRATTQNLELRNSPVSESSISQVAPISDSKALPFDKVVTKTIEAGNIKVSGDVFVKTRSFGEIEKLTAEAYYDESIAWEDRTINADDKPTLLMWLSEGNCLIKIKQTVDEISDCPTESAGLWVLLNQPKTETWIEARINESKGWVKVDGQQVKEVSRNF
ncbi:hypothetical protein [Limnobacter parvus]|uniref:Lipoprotein n=1 Tax=Limnobacter parvus TaxID=2939690 RepID=A0ABT1XEL9_9BURK|nr:hypothetical protein [Limnobacter parvus]MCR2745351.1 hypothetical protein [Limnobacter parvus]